MTWNTLATKSSKLPPRSSSPHFVNNNFHPFKQPFPKIDLENFEKLRFFLSFSSFLFLTEVVWRSIPPMISSSSVSGNSSAAPSPSSLFRAVYFFSRSLELHTRPRAPCINETRVIIVLGRERWTSEIPFQPLSQVVLDTVARGSLWRRWRVRNEDRDLVNHFSAGYMSREIYFANIPLSLSLARSVELVF